MVQALNLVNSQRVTVSLSSGGNTTSSPLTQGTYAVWGANDFSVAAFTTPEAFASSLGYLIKGGAEPVPLYVPPNGYLAFAQGSTMAATTVNYQKVV